MSRQPEPTITIHFHVVLSPEFSRSEEDKLVILFGQPLGDWGQTIQKDKYTMKIDR